MCASSGSYLPAGYSFPSYGGKVPAGDEGDKPSRSSPTVKPPSEAKALELLQQHASQYKSKSPSVPDSKPPHERDRERLLPSHHHLGYPLLAAQYDLSYASGEGRPANAALTTFKMSDQRLRPPGLSSSAIVASQQASAPSMYPPARR